MTDHEEIEAHAFAASLLMPAELVRSDLQRLPAAAVELCFFAPTYASWAHPIEAHFGPLRQFTVANSNHRNHPVQTRALHAYLRWRDANARHPDVLATERKERARIRNEKGLRWGGRPLPTAA